MVESFPSLEKYTIKKCAHTNTHHNQIAENQRSEKKKREKQRNNALMSSRFLIRIHGGQKSVEDTF